MFEEKIEFRLEWNEESQEVCKNIIESLKELDFNVKIYPFTAFCRYYGDKLSAIAIRRHLRMDYSMYISIFEQENPAETVLTIDCDHIASISSL